jgi:tetratricopeptide (TPR) repeat protein
MGEQPAQTANTISGGIQFGPVLQGRDIQATFQLPAVAPTALAQLPPLAAGFTGRGKELAELADLLNPLGPAGAGEPVLVAAVTGLAGVGKTTLAIAAAHAVLQQGLFGGGVLFIDLHGYDDHPVEPAQALDALLRALGVAAEHIPPTAEERAGLYRSVLAQIIEPVLVIADNTSFEAQVRPLLPGGGPHKVLVTSRHTLAGLRARLVDVTILDQDASVALLDAALRTARPGDDRITADLQAAGQLATICAGLPLALQITAALLTSDPTLTAAELAGDLAAEPARLDRLAYDDGSGTSAPSVAAAFGLSYRKLDDTSARVFRLLAVNPGPDISTAAAAALTGLPVAETRTVLGILARAHLAEAAPGSVGRWRTHDLLHLYAARLSSAYAEADGLDQARDRLLGYYLNTTEAADSHLRAPTGTAVPDCFTGRDDALAWLDTERAGLVGAVMMAADSGRDQVALRLPLALGAYLNWRRQFDDKLAVTAVSLDAARRLGDRHREGGALNNLGLTLRDVRRFDEAITAHEDAATIFHQFGDLHNEGQALNNLGLALQGLRRFDEAIAAYEEAAAIYRDAGDRHGEGQTLNNLGAALQELRRFDKAIGAHQEAAAIFRETSDHHGEGTALNNLGAALRRVHRFDEAMTTYQEAAAIFRETGDQHAEGEALYNLGIVLRETGRMEEAISAHDTAAIIFRDSADLRAQSEALNNLGLTLQAVGRFDEAITAHLSAVAIDRETGERHSEGQALSNLGLALQEVRRFDEAVAALMSGAAIFRETDDQRGEAAALISLGRVFSEQLRPDQAIIAHGHAATMFQETGDQEGEGTALDCLGLAMQQARRFDEAVIAHQDAAAIFREIGDRHSVGAVMNNLGVALQEVGRFDDAIAAHQNAATIFREIGDPMGERAALNNLDIDRAARQT